MTILSFDTCTETIQSDTNTHKHKLIQPLGTLKQSIVNAFTLHDICFAVCHFTNIMVPRSFSRSFRLKPFAIDAH